MKRKLSEESYKVKYIYPIDFDFSNNQLITVELPPIMGSVFKPMGRGIFVPESLTNRELFYCMN